MSHDEKEVQQILEESLALYKNAPPEDVSSGVDRVWQNLRPGGDRTSKYATLAVRPAREVSMSWRLVQIGAPAVVVLLIVLSVVLVRDFIGTKHIYATLEATDSQLYQRSGGETRVVPIGGVIDANAVVRSAGAGAVLALPDGSRVEMRAQSELSLERADDGIRIHLFRGGLIINAAKERTGHLYVRTKEVTVTVDGTVFLVNAEAEGSRVAVIEGKVRVQQGATKKSLLPGEQVATNPRMEALQAKDELSWSRNADMHLALLQQSAVPAAAPRQRQPELELEILDIQPFALQATLAFEVATIKPSKPGNRLQGGACRGTDSKYTGALGIAPPPLGRCSFIGMTLKMLLQEAYNLQGPSAREMVSGGPNWIDSERYDIQAKAEQPTVQADMRLMLQRLLSDRFALKVHRASKELPGFALVIAKNGPKLTEAPSDQERTGLWRVDGTHPWMARGVPMSQLATFLSLSLKQPVADETRLPGSYNFTLVWTPGENEGGAWREMIARLPPEIQSQIPGADPNGPSVFTAVQEQLGLRLEPRKVPAEIYVIDAAQRPTEN